MENARNWGRQSCQKSLFSLFHSEHKYFNGCEDWKSVEQEKAFKNYLNVFFVWSLPPVRSEGCSHMSYICCVLFRVIFHSSSFENPIFGTYIERVETAIFNSRVETLKVGLKIAVSTRSTVTSNQIFQRVAMINKMHYSKQNTAVRHRAWLQRHSMSELKEAFRELLQCIIMGLSSKNVYYQ